jgi:hypothetical protein
VTEFMQKDHPREGDEKNQTSKCRCVYHSSPLTNRNVP